MKGLLLKDYYMIKNYCRTHFLVCLLFIVLTCVTGGSNSFLILYPCLLISMIPMTLLAYDEREKWDIYVRTMPYSADQLVTVKYLLCVILDLSMFFLIAAVLGGSLFLTHGFLPETVAKYRMLLEMLIAVILIFPALFLPFAFWLGTEKGRIAYYILIIVFSAASAAVISSDFAIAAIPVTLQKFLHVGAWFPALLGGQLFLVSWRLSVVLYRRRLQAD